VSGGPDPGADGRAPSGGSSPDTWPRNGQFASGLLIVFLGALLVRLIYLWELRDADVSFILVGDAYLYDRWAREIARGDWLGRAPFYQAPLYPYFLAALYKLLAPSLVVVRLVQALLGATACVLLALAGRAFFSPAVGLIAGGILAAYAPAVFFDGLIQKAALDLVLATALLWLLGGLGPDLGAGRTLAVGLALGLLCLTRENALVLIPVVAAWLLAAFGAVPARRRLGYAGVFLAGIGLVLGPVALRSRAVGGEWFLTTAQLGPNLYIGNHARATGFYAPLRSGRGDSRFERQDATELAQVALGRPLTAGEVSRYWTGRTLADVRAAPGRWVRLLGWKLALTWNGGEVIDSEDPAVYADSSVLFRGLGWLVHFGTVAPLAAVGLWITRRQWRRLWLLYAMLAAVTVSVVLFYVFGRYRYLLVPVVVLFAATGIDGAVDAGRRRRWREMAVAVGILGVVGLGVNLPLARDPLARAVMYRNLGTALGREGLPEEALQYYRKAIAASPSYVEARMSLARTLAALGRRDEALGEYLMVLSLRPDLKEAEAGVQALLLGGKPPRSGPPVTPR
jgi:4-amino-4-deoxy-L-arabinose transferase-like glycosyltransferase